MTYTIRTIEQSDTLAVSLDDAKAHLNVEDTDWDDMITAMIMAATGYAESFMGRALVETTFDLVRDTFPKGPIELPRSPLIDVVGVFHRNAEGGEDELDEFAVDTNSEPGRIYRLNGAAWPTVNSPGGVRIRFRAGYVRLVGSPAAADGAVPFDIQAAIKLMVGTLYMQRETINIGNIVNDIPWSAEQLMRRHRLELSLA